MQGLPNMTIKLSNSIDPPGTIHINDVNQRKLAHEINHVGSDKKDIINQIIALKVNENRVSQHDLLLAILIFINKIDAAESKIIYDWEFYKWIEEKKQRLIHPNNQAKIEDIILCSQREKKLNELLSQFREKLMSTVLT
jgi:hypothetical protein